jgi:hypothetical protein
LQDVFHGGPLPRESVAQYYCAAASQNEIAKICKLLAEAMLQIANKARDATPATKEPQPRPCGILKCQPIKAHFGVFGDHKQGDCAPASGAD